MTRITIPRLPSAIASLPTNHLTAVFLTLGLMLLAFQVGAATNTGPALQSAYTALNDLVNGYGKQVLTLIGFVIAAFGFLASNATGVIAKFIGYAIFLGVGLAAALVLVGATV